MKGLVNKHLAAAHRKPIRRRSPLLKGIIRAGLFSAIVGSFFVFSPLVESYGDYLSKILGLRIEEIYVEGRDRLNPLVLKEKIGIQKGDSIFSLSPQEIKQRIESLSWVRSVSVERRLPDVFYIHLVERRPIALWQKNKNFFLVDEIGYIIDKVAYRDFHHLPIIIGDKAPSCAKELLKTLEVFPSIMSRLTAATHLYGRRWDLLLDKKLIIKLPEDHINSVIKAFIDVEKKYALDTKDISIIDLRFSHQFILRTSPQIMEQLRPKRKKEGKDT